jgi:hypothetical protein
MDLSLATSWCPHIIVSLPLSFHLFYLLIHQLCFTPSLFLCFSHLCVCGWYRKWEVKEERH